MPGTVATARLGAGVVVAPRQAAVLLEPPPPPQAATVTTTAARSTPCPAARRRRHRVGGVASRAVVDLLTRASLDRWRRSPPKRATVPGRPRRSGPGRAGGAGGEGVSAWLAAFRPLAPRAPGPELHGRLRRRAATRVGERRRVAG